MVSKSAFLPTVGSEEATLSAERPAYTITPFVLVTSSEQCLGRALTWRHHTLNSSPLLCPGAVFLLGLPSSFQGRELPCEPLPSHVLGSDAHPGTCSWQGHLATSCFFSGLRHSNIWHCSFCPLVLRPCHDWVGHWASLQSLMLMVTRGAIYFMTWDSHPKL